MESFYQTSPLERLCNITDWESPPVSVPLALTPYERIEQDSQTLRTLKRNLSHPDFNVLKIIYCRNMDIEQWRASLDALIPSIKLQAGRIRFKRHLYEYTCIHYLTHQKIKAIRFSDSTVRHNKHRVCLILDNLSHAAHQRAKTLFLDNGMVYW